MSGESVGKQLDRESSVDGSKTRRADESQIVNRQPAEKNRDETPPLPIGTRTAARHLGQRPS